MRILLGHTFPDRAAFGRLWIEQWLSRLRANGIEAQPFSLVIDQDRPVVPFDELAVLWRYGDRKLLSMYERLAVAASDFDVFVCFTGANVHPDFLSNLQCVTVYSCFDDPESSDMLSKPVAASFDMAMVGNIAELDSYKSWGVTNVRWWPLGFRQDDYDPQLTEEAILQGHRPVEVALLCERVTRFRRKRVDQFVDAFPNGAYYGQGWPSGFLPESKRVPLLQQTRIGINIHNSTGPINFRTFYLPANGVLQICDNKSHLGKIYKLGTEVVGYETIKEAIELTDYYLNHDEERRRIAAAGWKRALAEYNEVACFKRLIDGVTELVSYSSYQRKAATPSFPSHKRGVVHGLIVFILMALHATKRRTRVAIRRMIETF